MKKLTTFVLVICSFWIINAQIKLPAIFTEGMVLQHGKQIKISGKAASGQEVRLNFGNQLKSSTTDVYGAFEIWLDTMGISVIPQTLRIKCNQDSLLINDVLVGDVFLLSGQSNMAWKISNLDADQITEAKADSDYPNLRYYEVAKNYVANSVLGNDAIADIPWCKSGAATVVNMSAVGFYYGRRLYKDKNIPIGLIDCSQGSSSGDAWISQYYIDNHPEIKLYLFEPVQTNAQYYKNPGILYKQMLSRVLPYPVNGILWYQGEANAATYDNYKKVLPAVIASFRESYSDNTLPFVIIQLSAYENPNSWPHLREVQDSVANATPYSAMVSSIDVGTANQIHPKNKKPVGERCVLAMRKLRYGEDITYAGPAYLTVRFEGNKAIISFNNANGLKTVNNILSGFEICDDSYTYQPVTGAEISGNEIAVWSSAVNAPKAVRYGWSNFPPPNLYNDKSLPANPFRTSKQSTSSFTSNLFYVSASEGDDANEGSLESQFATITRATSVVNQDNTVIYVAPGTYVFSVPATIKPFTQTITGENAATTIFDGNATTSLLNGVNEMENSGKKLTIKGIAFKNATISSAVSTTGGSAIRMGTKTNLSLEDCCFYKNMSTNAGVNVAAGSVYFSGNDISVNRCFFEENTNAAGPGGAITVKLKSSVDGPANAVIKNSTFYKNAITLSGQRGGAIYFDRLFAGSATPDTDHATFVVQNCVFLENTSAAPGTAGEIGGAILLSSGGSATNGYNDNLKRISIILTNNTMVDNYVKYNNIASRQNAVLFEGFLYEAYLANNIITCDVVSGGYSLSANQTNSIQYGKNNIIDLVSPQINGADFSTNAMLNNNVLTAITTEAAGVNKTLLGFPVGNTFAVPYLSIVNGPAVDAGTNSYLVNTIANPAPAAPVEYVTTTDIHGSVLINNRDLGAWEYNRQTGINTTPSEKEDIIVFPNPVLDKLYIKHEREVSVVEFFDYSGKNAMISFNQKIINVESLAKGLYIIRITDSENNTYKIHFSKY